jgi:hypothetical protein
LIGIGKIVAQFQYNAVDISKNDASEKEGLSGDMEMG